MENLSKINRDLRDKILKLERDKQDLGIKAKEKPKLSDMSLTVYKGMYNGFFKSMVAMVRCACKREWDKTKIKVPQNFLLQDLFDSWHTKARNGGCAGGAYLLQDLDKLKYRKETGRNISLLFREWNIMYETVSKMGRTKRQQENFRQEETIDAGGPTREFLSQVWQQAGDLYVGVEIKKELDELPVGMKVKVPFGDNPVDGRVVGIEKSEGPEVFKIKCVDGKIFHLSREDFRLDVYPVNMFETENGYLVPVTDEVLKHKFKLVQKYGAPEIQDLLDKAKHYYRAFGRLMFHALLTDYPISSTALPSFFRNVILRGWPEDDDYDRSELLQHINEIGFQYSGNIKEHFLGQPLSLYLKEGSPNELITIESFFKVVLPEILVNNRSIAIDAIKEGLTLDGHIQFPNIFRAMPLEALGKVVFSNPIITSEDVISLMEPEYCVELSYEPVDEQLIEGQRLFFKETLPKALRTKEENERANECEYKKKVANKTDFLSKFVSFSTGYAYLPHCDVGSEFKITIEFDFAESTEDSLPVAHTCENILKFPGWVYDNNVEKLLASLDKSFDLVGATFGMN
uniref:HECT domain-containing protein n=1 Tax=Trieres chinensis TaxID=1514140 RepID=A0A7S2EI47_TRICV|mmetsp:Transcript_24804/g.50372  ORF Transcript_24804/g.50372 Transcript_24804/m.50372 type:complete len:572 (+) Transcript_24804:259-1974(+)